MDKELDRFIQHIQDGIVNTLKNDIFDDKVNYDVLIDACKLFLIYKGYKVVGPVEYTYSVRKLDDLIHLFYALSDAKHPEFINNYRNLVRDRVLAKRFIESRMKISGVNKKEAMNECAEIIDTIFIHEKEFNFDTPLVFGMLGQKKLGWITEKAIQIINKRKLNSEREGRDKLITAFEKIYDAEPGEGFGDLNEILKNL